MHGRCADDPESRIRFGREVPAARQLSGAFTAPTVDADVDGTPWTATLSVPGETPFIFAAKARCRCRSCANSPSARPRP